MDVVHLDARVHDHVRQASTQRSGVREIDRRHDAAVDQVEILRQHQRRERHLQIVHNGGVHLQQRIRQE